MVGNLTFGRHRTAGDVGDAELTALRLMAAHVRRAITISHLLEVKTLEALTFASALETLTAGVVLVDETWGSCMPMLPPGRCCVHGSPSGHSRAG